MTAEYYRQRIWVLQQKRSKLEQTIYEKEKELKKMQDLSSNISSGEASFSTNCGNYLSSVQRIRLLEQPTKSQEAFAQSAQGYLSGSDYQHTKNCISVLRRRAATVIDQTKRELSKAKQEVSNINNEITQLRRLLDAAIAQEAALNIE